MKFLLAILIAFPIIANAQVKKTKPTVKAKTKVITNTTKPQSVKHTPDVAGGYTINVQIEGAAEGALVKILNGNTGAEEGTAILKQSKCSFKGKVENPDFKVIGINGQAPFITLFLDNSMVRVTAKVGSLDKATVTGSTSHADFIVFNKATSKYQDLFAGKGNYDVAFLEAAGIAIENFVKENPNSYVSPLAIFRHNQVTGDYAKQETLFNTLSENIRNSAIGKYVAQQIGSNTAAGYGKPLANFSQADTTGNEISLAAFKGKYVLVDFWASWCRPCRMENPNVVRTYEKYKNKNFTVLGVSLDQDKQKWVSAIAEDNLNWTNLSDLKGWSNAVAAQFAIQSIPQNLLIDPAGNLIGKNLRGSALEYRLMQVIK